MQVADLYIRVSTDDQRDKGFSQRSQEEVLRRYCDHNFIQIRQVIFEDHSAKTFNRPQWNKLLFDWRKKKNQVDLVLFTKWDRFSRNAGDAYQMISTIRKLGVEPQAIEQPLDMTIPESKIMMAVYLSTPEVENDRRALNVFYGMRRARKEGRWMGTAPIGYQNKTDESGKIKYICPKQPEADIMRWVFEEIASNRFNTEQILQMARKRGLKCSKNNFWVAIRNPIYCGKIHVPKFKDEESIFVQGKHQPIISSTLFYLVQEILDGRRKEQRTKMVVDSKLPLRGFLVCPRCGRVLTGSASKGKYKHYHYYHCITSCGCRFPAERANQLFSKELRKFVPQSPFRDIFRPALEYYFKAQTKSINDERDSLLSQIDTYTDLIREARKCLFQHKITDEDFRQSKEEYEKAISKLEDRLAEIPKKNYNIEGILEKGMRNLSQLDTLYESGGVETQRQIISSIYPDKLVFTGDAYRTPRVNYAVQLIYSMDKALAEKENGTSLSVLDLSHKVIPLGLEPRAHTLKVYCSTN
ncbi:recombinase RecB [Chitinophaga terrae (ex Kim and Jung 2007)]|nr:recombinase RecB [Chitinophaga terrae (ex Kim and Jung 2007)]